MRIARFGDEAAFRTAIGRAYYAAYLVAVEKTRIPEGPNRHRRLIDHMSSRGWHEISSDLYRLRRLRVGADYQMAPLRNPGKGWDAYWLQARALADRLIFALDRL